MNAQAITWPQGRYNPAGVTKIWYAFTEDIATFPTADDPETGLTYASLVELATAITMKVGKQFFELYCTLEEGEVKSTMVGSRDGKGFENTIELSFPGSDSTYNGFVAASANRTMVFIVKEKNGKLRVIGTLEDPAYIESMEFTSGKKIADARKSTLMAKASAATPAPIYTQPIAALLAPAA